MTWKVSTATGTYVGYVLLRVFSSDSWASRLIIAITLAIDCSCSDSVIRTVIAVSCAIMCVAANNAHKLLNE